MAVILLAVLLYGLAPRAPFEEQELEALLDKARLPQLEVKSEALRFTSVLAILCLREVQASRGSRRPFSLELHAKLEVHKFNKEQ